MSSRLGFRPSVLWTVLLGLVSILPRAAAAQSGTAPTGDPGGFGIDGDLGANTPTADISDWIPWDAGTGSSVLFSNGDPTTSLTVHGVDEYNNSDLIFVNNLSRLDTNPSTDWTWDTPGMDPLGGKENLGHGLAHFSRDSNAHTWFTWAVDRRGGGGQSYIGVSLYQNSLVRNGNGTFSSTGPHGGHTVGDLVLSLELMDLTTSLPVLTVWRWTQTGPTTYGYTSLTPCGRAHSDLAGGSRIRNRARAAPRRS